jgi:hypothetical protein
MFIEIKDDIIHECLGSNFVVIQKQLEGVTSLITELSGRTTSIIDITNFALKINVIFMK